MLIRMEDGESFDLHSIEPGAVGATEILDGEVGCTLNQRHLGVVSGN
jgi:hypothetical protein